MSDVSLVYITHRAQPRFDWFADSLANQLDDTALEVVFVDGLFSPERNQELDEIVRGRFAFRHVPAKPTPWNGEHRLTRTEYFAPSSARNTGIVHAQSPYLLFVDDCSLLMPGWWLEARRAARRGYVVAGAYKKRARMTVEEGVLVDSSDAPSARDPVDARWQLGDDAHPVPVTGGHLFGCSFGAPRELLLSVNGLDELTDGLGEGDCQLGVRLERTGATVFYARRMLTVESADQYDLGPPLAKLGAELDAETYMSRLRESGVERRTTEGTFSNRLMMWDLTFGLRAKRSLGNHYELASLTPQTLDGTRDSFPTTYWFDGRELAEL